MPTAKTYRDGLAALIAELNRDGRGKQRIPLRDGKRKEAKAIGSLYVFAWSKPVDLVFEGARVEFQTGNDKQEAIVAFISAGNIALQLTRDLGESIDTATIVVDQTGFLDALRRRMDDITTGCATAFDAARAEQVLSNSQSPMPAASFDGAEALSEAQRKFVGLALSGPLTWLWGHSRRRCRPACAGRGNPSVPNG